MVDRIEWYKVFELLSFLLINKDFMLSDKISKVKFEYFENFILVVISWNVK